LALADVQRFRDYLPKKVTDSTARAVLDRDADAIAAKIRG
jgi:hypothetical protein